jgi:hypothetical protein
MAKCVTRYIQKIIESIDYNIENYKLKLAKV